MKIFVSATEFYRCTTSSPGRFSLVLEVGREKAQRPKAREKHPLDEVCRCNKSQIRLKLCDLLRRQNSVAATKIFTKILQCKRSVLSLQRVSATCCCNLSPRVYRTYPGFYLAMSFKVYRSAAQLCSITEIAPKSPFLCVNRNPIQYGFPAGAKAMRYSMNTYPIC